MRLSREAARAFEQLDARDKERVRQALVRLARAAADAGRIGGKSVKTIQGTEDVFHRVRVGDVRVMHDVIPEERVVLVLGIVPRADLERWLRGR